MRINKRVIIAIVEGVFLGDGVMNMSNEIQLGVINGGAMHYCVPIGPQRKTELDQRLDELIFYPLHITTGGTLAFGGSAISITIIGAHNVTFKLTVIYCGLRHLFKYFFDFVA